MKHHYIHSQTEFLSPLYYIDVKNKGAHIGQVGLTDPLHEKGAAKTIYNKVL